MKKLLLATLLLFVITTLSSFQIKAQGVYLMCSTTSTVDSTGTLYDSGGLGGDYIINEDCSLLIAPSFATSITLSFQQFDTEDGYDFFRVYNGTTTSDPMILEADGSILPSQVVACSGTMLIVWHADFTIVASGFQCSWTSVIAPSVALAAAFSIGNTNPPLSAEVQFTDQSVGHTSGWLWYFGDGDTARSQNPTHAYQVTGMQTVTLISFHCSESDTISHTIDIQGAPEIVVDTVPGFSASLACGDSANFTLDIGNIGSGQLVYELSGVNTGTIKVLAMTYGTNQFVEYPRTIAAINQFFTNYTLTPTGTIDPGTLSGLLVGKNVLLIPEQQSGSSAVWAGFGPVIRQYLTNGGSVVFCGSNSSFADNLFVTGVFTGAFAENETGFSLDVLNFTDPLTTGLSQSTFIGPTATYSMNITNPDKVTLVDFQGNDVVTYRYFGSGKAIFVGFDYNTSNATTQRLIANAIEWGGQNALPPWIHLSTLTDTVDPSDTSHVGVTFVASGFPAGTYYANIGVTSNDPVTPLVVVPCTLTVSGFPIIDLSTNCLNIGQVMQHTISRDTLRITNVGCDTLKFSNFTNSSPGFTYSPTFSYLLPGAFSDLVVTFNGSTVGSYSDTLHILNNDVDTFICLTATTFPAPIVSASVGSITEQIRACDVDGNTSFQISNTGGSDLIFHFGNLPSWLSALPQVDTLAPNDSVTINLSFNSASFSMGNQNTNVIIISNDPLFPNKNIPFIMQVDSNPCVDYTFVSNTCTGSTDFTSTAINIPTTYYWYFGDGDSSNLENPNHIYLINGTYNISLIVCNFDGCDTTNQTINAVITGPKPAECQPGTAAYCCDIGIVSFKVSDGFGFMFNNTSGDAVELYQDYTCTDNATLITNFPYTLEVITGPTYEESLKAWLDLNNDGHLDSLSELVYSDSAKFTSHTGILSIPSLPTNVYGAPLRLRIASDYSGNPNPEPCLELQYGQHEDYSVFLNFYDGINEFNFETGFKVYPNPFEQSSNIEYNLKSTAKVSVEIFNTLGEMISSFVSNEIQSSGKHSYVFSGHPSGVYFVKLSVDNKSSIQKIMKM